MLILHKYLVTAATAWQEQDEQEASNTTTRECVRASESDAERNILIMKKECGDVFAVCYQVFACLADS